MRRRIHSASKVLPETLCREQTRATFEVKTVQLFSRRMSFDVSDATPFKSDSDIGDASKIMRLLYFCQICFRQVYEVRVKVLLRTCNLWMCD